MKRREYEHGSAYALWRWKDIYWGDTLYLRRLILLQCPWFSVMLHWFHAPDQQRHLHDHPISFISFILWGSYDEVRPGRGPRLVRWFNFIRATDAHQITHVSPGRTPVTLCFGGPRVRQWGFHTEDGWVHWYEYHRLYEGSTS